MKTVKNNLYLLKMVCSIDQKKIWYTVSLSLISAIKNIINVIFIKLALDCVITYQSFQYLLLLVIAEVIISSILSWLECLVQWEKNPISDNVIKKHLLENVYQKSREIELSKLDNPEFYDKFNRAVNEAEQGPSEMISTIESFFSSLLTIVSISAIVIVLDRSLIILAVISSVASALLNAVISKLNYKVDKALTRPSRKIGYIRRLYYLPQYLEEMKTCNYNGLLSGKLESSTEEYNIEIQKYRPKTAFFQIIRNWQIFVMNFGIVSLFIGRRIIMGTLDVTSFTSLIYASTTLSNSLADLFSILPQMKQNALFIDNLREILDYKSSMEPTKESKTVPKDKSHSIVLDHVSFRYHPGADNILKDISLEIKKGEKIALVGENGAGKSTLTKLILRLYDPQSGNIYLDGENYKDLDVNSLRREIAVVYQDFQSFAFTIGENVLTREVREGEDEQVVWEALKKSGLSHKVEVLPQTIHTPLTNEFEENGTNLSGGENQKLAIARAVCKDAGVVIMDEPSSSLDPRSESEMYQNMFDICKDKTLILISHRLYSTRMVDRIYYVEDGSIQESGSHEELVQLNGKYADLYRIQAEQYK